MKSWLGSFGFCAALLCWGGSALSVAGDKKKDPLEIPAPVLGPEHKILEGLVGTFDAKVKLFTDPKAPPAESTGVMTRKMILDGNFLQETYKGKFSGKDFNGMGVIGYDSLKKKFVTVWFDSAATSTTLMHGTYDADKKVFTTLGEEPDSKGRKMIARDVLKIVSADEQHFEMYRQLDAASPEIKVMEITYTRKK